jgi:hypothetical protein
MQARKLERHPCGKFSVQNNLRTAIGASHNSNMTGRGRVETHGEGHIGEHEFHYSTQVCSKKLR